MTALETANLIDDYRRAVAEYLLLAQEEQRRGQGEVQWLLEEPYVVGLGRQLVHDLEGRGIDTKELRRFQRAVSIWRPEAAFSLWEELELDLEGTALRLRHGAGFVPASSITEEAPAVAVTVDPPVAVDAPAVNDTTKERPPLKREERESAVAAYLRDHPGATIKAVSAAVGASTGAVYRTAAWQAEMERRKAKQSSRGEPCMCQLVNPEESSLLIDNRDPADTVIDAEEATDEGMWQRLLDAASLQQRAALHACTDEVRKALIQNIRDGSSGDELQGIIAAFAEQREDQSSEKRGKRRRS